VRGNLITTLTHIGLNNLLSVDGDSLEGVDGDKEKTGVSVDDISLVTKTQVVQDGRLGQVRDGRAILNTIKLGRVTLVLVSLGLGQDDFNVSLVVLNLNLVAIVRCDGTSVVARSGLIIDPDVGLVSRVVKGEALRSKKESKK
jgi:hypothetical protein